MRAWWIFFFPVFCCCSFCISFVIVVDDKIEAHCIYCVFLGGCSGSILLWWGRWKIAQICVHCMQTSSAITCIYPLSYVYYYIKAQKKNVRRSPEKNPLCNKRLGLTLLGMPCTASKPKADLPFTPR